MNEQDYKEYQELINEGHSQRSAAKILGISRSSIQRHIKKQLEADSIRNSAFNVQNQNDYISWQSRLKPSVAQGDKVPRTLFWDLESSLLEGYFFRIWQENIPMRRIKKQSHLLSASFSYNNDVVQGYRLTPEQVKTGDDFDVVRKMVEAINNCDLMVTFNGKRFDVKLLNTRALFWGLPPVKSPKHIDLFEQSKRVFKFPSNSMQTLFIKTVTKYLLSLFQILIKLWVSPSPNPHIKRIRPSRIRLQQCYQRNARCDPFNDLAHDLSARKKVS